jgi:hypothetical protein
LLVDPQALFLGTPDGFWDVAARADKYESVSFHVRKRWELLLGDEPTARSISRLRVETAARTRS